MSNWDESFDVIVMGAGAAGMTAALTAKNEGLSVLLLEKTDRIGGSTAISGGVVWAPANDQALKQGHIDSPEEGLLYLNEIVGNDSSEILREKFVRSVSHALNYMEENDFVKFNPREHAPDYYPNKKGAKLGGRALDPVIFDGKKLKNKFKELRNPLEQFMVLNGMMVNTADVKNLLSAAKDFGSFKQAYNILCRYFIDRIRGYHRGTRLVLGNSLAAQLFYSIIRLGIKYLTSVNVIEVYRGKGRIEGVKIISKNKELKIEAKKGLVIACGGFPWNELMRSELFPKPNDLWSMAPKENSGDGIKTAIGIGARLSNKNAGPALWAPISININKNGEVVRYPHLIWDRSKPGLIAVNKNGLRFVNESTSYHEFVLGMYKSHNSVQTIPAFLICDSNFMDKWGLGLALPGGAPRNHLIKSGYLYKESSLSLLAKKLDIDYQGLLKSVFQMNNATDLGVDSAFNKGGDEYNRYLGDGSLKNKNPCLGKIEKSPFYAIKVYPGDIGTATGIECNEYSQALDENGDSIMGLYVCGNDMNSVMGGHYPSAGITLGPAITFGWLAGKHISRNIEK